jgi:MFS family permease
MGSGTSSAASAGNPSGRTSAIDAQSAAALFAAATVGFGSNLAIQLVNLRLHTQGVTAGLIGLSTMVQAIGIVVAALLVPHVMQRWGARTTMVAGASLAAATMIGFAHANGFLVLTAMRVAYAIGLAFVFSCAEYVVLRQASEGQSGYAAGLYASVVGLGMAVGPAWIALVGSDGPVAYYSGAWLCLTCIPAARALDSVPVSLPGPRGSRVPLLKLAPLGFAAAFIFGFIDNGPVALLPIGGLSHGWTSEHSVLLVTAVTLAAVAFQWPVGQAIDRFGAGLVFRVGLLCAALVMLMLPHIWHQPALVVLAVIALGVVMEGFYTTGLADIGRRIEPGHLAGANALFVALCGAGEIVGPAVTGFALEVLN